MCHSYIKNNLCIFVMSKRTKVINLKKTEMKKQKDELEEINFRFLESSMQSSNTEKGAKL